MVVVLVVFCVYCIWFITCACLCCVLKWVSVVRETYRVELYDFLLCVFNVMVWFVCALVCDGVWCVGAIV